MLCYVKIPPLKLHTVATQELPCCFFVLIYFSCACCFTLRLSVAEKFCPEGFAKCPASYCVAVSLLCDGHPDCPEGEDETMLGKNMTVRLLMVMTTTCCVKFPEMPRVYILILLRIYPTNILPFGKWRMLLKLLLLVSDVPAYACIAISWLLGWKKTSFALTIQYNTIQYWKLL